MCLGLSVNAMSTSSCPTLTSTLQVLPPPVPEPSINTFQAWSGHQQYGQQQGTTYYNHTLIAVPPPQSTSSTIPVNMTKRTKAQDYYMASSNNPHFTPSNQAYSSQTPRSASTSNSTTLPHQRTSTQHQSYPHAYINQLQQHIRPGELSDVY